MHIFDILLEADAVGFHPDDFKSHFANNTLRGAVHPRVDDALNRLLPDISHLTPDHREAIIHWAGNNSKKGRYREINSHLRKQELLRNDLGRVIPILRDLVTARPLAHDTHVYRGVHPPLSQDIEALQPGDVYRDKAFLSTTIDPTRAAYFRRHDGLIMHIFLPAGSAAAYLDHPEITPFSEKEVLLLPNSPLRFLQASEMPQSNGRLYHFRLE